MDASRLHEQAVDLLDRFLLDHCRDDGYRQALGQYWPGALWDHSEERLTRIHCQLAARAYRRWCRWSAT